MMECWIRMCFANASERVKDLSHWASGQRKGWERVGSGEDECEEERENEERGKKEGGGKGELEGREGRRRARRNAPSLPNET